MAGEQYVFVSYARQDGEAAAKQLVEELGKDSRVHPWRDRLQMRPGDFEEQIRQAIESSRYIVLVLTPAAISSDWVKKEWRLAQKRGVCVLPVKSAPETEQSRLRDQLPRWISQAHEYDLEREWELFVNQLNSPCRATRAPYMAGDLPFNFVKREDQFRQIVDQVLDGNRKNPSGKTVVLEGAGGFGKTTLALDVCDDDDVITACDGGILWVTLGEQPRVKDELTSIYAALTGERPQFKDEVEAARELFDRLEGKRCLLVIDDVWQLDHIQHLLHGDGMITRLITTRDSRIAADAARNPIRLPVAELKPAEAESLLISRLRAPTGDPAPFRKLAERLGNWPLLLELANGALRAREDAKDTLVGALSWMNQALDRKGVLAFNRENARQRHDTIGKTVEISLELLGKERQRCLELGIFPDDVDIPLSVVALIWHVDEFETESLAQRISQLSLAKLNFARRNLRLHDAMRAYMASQLGEAGLRCHAKLSGWWKDPARLPDGYPKRLRRLSRGSRDEPPRRGGNTHAPAYRPAHQRTVPDLAAHAW